MRFKSNVKNGYCIYAVVGTNTASFAIDFKKANTKGLLGFSVKRTYPDGTVQYMPGFKIFGKAINEKTDPQKGVSTEDHPVQSFVWDDFTLKPGEEYTFYFEPIKGTPATDADGKVTGLVRENAIPIKIKTEPLFTNQAHDIFFNRGIASSQAYAREFNNTSPDKLVGKKQQDAFEWLGRDLDDAIFKFIKQAKSGDTILGCFYEFHYLPVVSAFKDAIDRGVKVKIIIDAKKNATTDKKNGKLGKNFPRDNNIETIKAAKIPLTHIIKREANANLIQHNKFMVFLKGASLKPTAVWMGSTNISENGIYGHTNVGHWVRNAAIAKSYKEYWELLSKDPGSKKGNDAATNKKATAAFKKQVVALQEDIDAATINDIPDGIIPIFSPRSTGGMLDSYFELVDKASASAAITLAFGINASLKTLLQQHTNKSTITFMLLEKKDQANARSTTPFVPLTAANNVYEAYGAFLNNPLYQWVKETNTRQFGMATNIAYIHSKFLLQNPLGDDPIVVTGSANFSTASTTGNDENMIIIRGDLRVADIYFTEFNRLFNHYYFRSIQDRVKQTPQKNNSASLFLDTTDSWLQKYKPGLLRFKRVDIYVNMKKAVILP